MDFFYTKILFCKYLPPFSACARERSTATRYALQKPIMSLFFSLRKPNAISNPSLNTSRELCAYMRILSTRSSFGAFVPRVLLRGRFGKDRLFSGTASCLDAFSSYQRQRSYPALPCQTTGTPEAATSCSSRTRDIFPSVNQQLQQIVTKLARTVLNPTNVRL